MKEQVSRLQFAFMVFWGILGTGILTMPFAVAHFTIHDGWLTPLMFLAGSVVSVFVCWMFVRTFPGCTLTEGLEQAYGPWLGRSLALWVLVMVYVMLCMLFRELTLFIEINALPLTPNYIDGAVAVAPLAYTAVLGIQSLARFTEFLTPLAVLLGTGIAALAAPNMDFSQLQPVLEYGLRPVYRGGMLLATGFAFEFVLSLQFVKTLKKPEKLPVDILATALLLTIIGFIVMVVDICVLGGAAAYLNYPILEVVRSVRVGDFLERFDTVYAMGVIATIIIKVGVWQYAWLTGVRDTARLSSYRAIAVAAPVAIWAGSIFLFRSSVELGEFMMYVTPSYFGFTLIVLPLATAAVEQLRRLLRRGAKPARSA